MFADITTSSAEVLVSSDDYDLSMGGGVSAALHRAAGEALLIDVAKKAPAKLGDVVVTTAGALPAEHIFHVITIGENQKNHGNSDVVENAINKCLTLLATLGLHSIAFPAIGTGVAQYNTDDVALKMAEVITKFLKSTDNQYDVSIFLYDRFGIKTTLDYIAFFEQCASRIGAPSIVATDEIPRKRESNDPMGRGSTAKQLSELTRERETIEVRLSELANGDSQVQADKLEKRLEEIHDERLTLLKQLRALSTEQGINIFISYSHKDRLYLEEFKSHLKSLERIGLVNSWHDRMISAGSEWKGIIDEKLAQAGVVLLLISASFIESEYCFDIELQEALNMHKAREALVIPIVIRPVVWDDLPFSRLQALPANGKAVSTWESSDLAWVDIIEGPKIAIREFQRQKRP